MERSLDTATLDLLLAEMVKTGGSDLLIAAGHPPAMRCHGRLSKSPLPPTRPEDVEAILEDLLSRSELQDLHRKLDLDFIRQVGGQDGRAQRFRVNAFYQRFGPSVVFRTIPKAIPTLADLGLPFELTELLNHREGLVVVGGPTGSGKTSTLAALVDHCNRTRALTIIALEEPVEFIHRPQKSLVVHRQIGLHAESYATALRGALREDPDMIVVGDLRDRESIALSLTASETGHLVLATMNTASSVQTIQRLINAFPAGQQDQVRTVLSESLRGVVSQLLIPRRGGPGRVPALEIVPISPVAALIREQKMHQVASTIASGKARGMRSMDQSLLDLVKSGAIELREALIRAQDPFIFQEPPP